MSQESIPLPARVQAQPHYPPLLPIVSPDEILSPEDKLVLYICFQDIAQELRRIRRERQKNQQARTQ